MLSRRVDSTMKSSYYLVSPACALPALAESRLRDEKGNPRQSLRVGEAVASAS